MECAVAEEFQQFSDDQSALGVPSGFRPGKFPIRSLAHLPLWHKHGLVFGHQRPSELEKSFKTCRFKRLLFGGKSCFPFLLYVHIKNFMKVVQRS